MDGADVGVSQGADGASAAELAAVLAALAALAALGYSLMKRGWHRHWTGQQVSAAERKPVYTYV
jgi:hypothetical protein